jgi:hypothetical protein
MTIGDVRRKRLGEFGAEARAIGVLMEHLTDVSTERLAKVAEDLERVAKSVRLLGRN